MSVLGLATSCSVHTLIYGHHCPLHPVVQNGMTSPADGNLTVWVHPAPPAAVTAVQTAKRLLSSFKVVWHTLT